MSLEAMLWAWKQPIKSHVAKLILLKLADNTNDETGACYPKHDTIAKHCECSRRTVIRHLKLLSDQGFLTIHHNFNNGRQKHNNYYLNLHKKSDLGVTESHTVEQIRGDRESHRRGDRESHHEPVRSITIRDLLVREKKFSDDDVKLARFIFKKIQDLNPKESTPNFDKWANTIRLIRERDKRTHREIQDVFLWANNDGFWQTNIRSPDKLRKQFTVLEDKKRQESTNEKNRGHHRPGSYEELESANEYALEKIRELEQEIDDEENPGSVHETLGTAAVALPASGVCLENGAG